MKNAPYRTLLRPLAGLSALVLAAWAAGPASAGVVVAPLKQEVTAKPGETAAFVISLANNAEPPAGRPVKVRLELLDFDVTEEGAIVFAAPGTQPDSATAWITLPKTEVVLAPGTGQRIEGRVKVPYTAQGEYYSAVMVTQVNERKSVKGLSVTYRIASGVFVTVGGRLFPRRAEVSRCEVVWPAASALNDAPKVVAVLRNTGRSRFDASGEVLVVSGQDRVVFRGRLSSPRATVHGGDSRRFECPLSAALTPGLYRVRVVMNYQSQWGKAETVSPLAVDAERAAVLAEAARRAGPPAAGPTAAPRLAVAPAKLAAELPPGGLRTLSLTVRNEGEASFSCAAGLVHIGGSAIPPSWVGMDGAAFVLDRGRSRSIPVVIQVPPDADGARAGTLVVEAVDQGGRKVRQEVPLMIAVKQVRGIS